MNSTTQSFTLAGIDAVPVTITAKVGSGSGSFTGLPALSARKYVRRIRSAVQAAGFTWPDDVQVHAEPAGRAGSTAGLDLAIAVAILLASGQVNADLAEFSYLGGLDVSGRVCPVRGVMASVARCPRIMVSSHSVQSATLAGAEEVIGLHNLSDLHRDLVYLQRSSSSSFTPETRTLDMADLSEWFLPAKRALMAAMLLGEGLALTGSSIAMTKLAVRVPHVMPALTHDEAVLLTRIQDAAGLRGEDSGLSMRPFRAPHYTISTAGMTGGRSSVGEICLAHLGVLFLNDMPEFRDDVLDAVWAVQQSSRMSCSSVYPTQFMLITASSLCPCGFLGRPTREGQCNCSPAAVAVYRQRARRLPSTLSVNLSYDGQPGFDRGLSSEDMRAMLEQARAVLASRGETWRRWEASALVSSALAALDGTSTVRPEHQVEASTLLSAVEPD